MEYKELYELWMNGCFDDETKKELASIAGDDKEIKERFYKDLEFGTGGLRGIMGAGTNRMNRYIIARATMGLANYLIQRRQALELIGKKDRRELSVAIAFDTRLGSRQFAGEAALVLAAKGIKAYLFDQVSPTPLLSFAVRHLGCDAGIVITASHNPKEYNGYKVYNETGCQLVPWEAEELMEYIACIDVSSCCEVGITADEAMAKGLLCSIGDEVINVFVDAVCTQAHELSGSAKDNLKIVYTPLHGSGNIPVRRALNKLGYNNVSIVKEQELPDGNFPTVKSPNPEDRAALVLGMELGRNIGADIVFGTDPDSDRIGVAAFHDGEYVLLTGNQTGALLVEYVLRKRREQLNSGSTVCNTIVTSQLGSVIARKYGCQVVNTLTGFKFIGEQINLFKESGEREFVIGYEESYGYLIGDHARDKDAVVSSLMICEMAAYYKEKGMDLIDALEAIYREYGFYSDALDTYTFKGIEGTLKMNSMMQELRTKGLDGAEENLDYLKGIDGLPKSDVLKFIFTDGSWVAVRPSGTEPKIKFYYSAVGKDKEASAQRLKELRQQMSVFTG